MFTASAVCLLQNAVQFLQLSRLIDDEARRQSALAKVKLRDFGAGQESQYIEQCIKKYARLQGGVSSTAPNAASAAMASSAAGIFHRGASLVFDRRTGSRSQLTEREQPQFTRGEGNRASNASADNEQVAQATQLVIS